MQRRITFLIYPSFQLLEAAGPIAAFDIANRYVPDSYRLRIAAVEPGPIASSSGATMQATELGRPRDIDTLIVVGGLGSRAAAVCPKTLRFVRSCGAAARRVASVCSGAYVLAAAGLLDGRSATTHWNCAQDFAMRFPRVRLDPDRIFINDGKLWTSAGITASIDLTLALIGKDLGEQVARSTAQQLIVYHRRPGGQSQFSPLLEMERVDGRFAALLDHIRSHLRARLSVADLASYACMSPRHFSRMFETEFGIGPAKAVERLRVDAARDALESGERSIKRIARISGFGSAERMRRSFLRVLGTAPSILKR